MARMKKPYPVTVPGDSDIHCPKCQGHDYEIRDKDGNPSNNTITETYRCESCGAYWTYTFEYFDWKAQGMWEDLSEEEKRKSEENRLEYERAKKEQLREEWKGYLAALIIIIILFYLLFIRTGIW